MSLVQRKIDVEFTLASDADGGPSSTVKATGYRAHVFVEKAGGISMGHLQCRIFGLSLSLMNQLTVLGKSPIAYKNNMVKVSVGDDTSGMSSIFSGTIYDGFVDAAGMPDVAFHVDAMAGLWQAVKPIDPSSYPGTANAADMLSDLANNMALVFENNSNVTVMLTDQYLPGTARQQAYAIAKAANCEIVIDMDKLAIWPKGQARQSVITTISPDTTLFGYPSFTSFGVSFRCLFEPDLAYGSLINLQSELKPACGKWAVTRLNYDLQSETPGGSWFCDIEASSPELVPLGR